MLKVYPVQKFLATVFKVAFYKSCSFIFMMTWIFSFAILPALKRAYSLLNLSRLFTVQLSMFSAFQQFVVSATTPISYQKLSFLSRTFFFLDLFAQKALCDGFLPAGQVIKLPCRPCRPLLCCKKLCYCIKYKCFCQQFFWYFFTFFAFSCSGQPLSRLPELLPVHFSRQLSGFL